MLSAEAEVESIRSVVAKHFEVYGVVVTPLALTFQVRVPPTGIDAPFDALRLELVPKDYVPTITRERGETLVHVQRRPKARFAGRQVNVILLILTVLTTVFFGGAWNWSDYAGTPFLSVESIGYGALFFSIPLLTILGSHEMGHYLVAKRYHVHASLPFFLPSVPPLGTFGAFISMRDPIPNRRALLDIGVSGPLVGFAIAIPVTIAGLALSAVSPTAAHALTENPRPSLLFLFLSQFFPLPGPIVQHPLAFAGWVGLFVTAINLLPAGQLDGGHVARALLGRRQFYVSWAAILILFGMSALYAGWFIFGFLIFMLGVRHPPPLNDLTPLDPPRKLIGVAAIVILLITFVPQPFAPQGTVRALTFEALDGSAINDINATIAVGTSVVLRFAVNNSGPFHQDVVVNLRQYNLESAGFVIRFIAIQIGTNTTAVNADTVTLALNASQRAILDLRVTAPATWPVPLPRDVEFQVHATTPDEAVSNDLQARLRVTA